MYHLPLMFSVAMYISDNLLNWIWKMEHYFKLILYLYISMYSLTITEYPTFFQVCDFGKYKSFIVPPQYVYVLSKKIKIPPTSSIRYVDRIDDPSWTDWSPIFVLGQYLFIHTLSSFYICILKIDDCQLIYF